MDFLSGSYPLGKDISCSQMLTSVWEKTTGTKRCYSMGWGGGENLLRKDISKIKVLFPQ